MTAATVSRLEEMASIRLELQQKGRLKRYPMRATNQHGCKILLAMIGEELDFRSLFLSSFRDLLIGASERLERVESLRLLTGEQCHVFAVGLEKLIATMPQSVTLYDLLTSDAASWPSGVAEASKDLCDLGLFLPYSLLPDSHRSDLKYFLDDEGEGFIDRLGFTRICDYMGFPREFFSEEELELFARTRRLGITLPHVHYPLPRTEKTIEITALVNGKCWNGSACVSSRDLNCDGGPGPGTDYCPG